MLYRSDEPTRSLNDVARAFGNDGVSDSLETEELMSAVDGRGNRVIDLQDGPFRALVVILPSAPSIGSPLGEASPNRCSLAIQNEDIFQPERRNAARPSGAVQEFDIRTVWWQQLDDGPNIADLDVGIIAAVDYGDQV